MFAAPFASLITRFRRWLGAAEVFTVRGFQVVVENNRPDIETPKVLARLDEALALIEQYQPWRLAHLRRDLRQFWIVRYPCRGAYFPGAGTCMTELTFLARTDIGAEVVASSIVHEGVHARVDRVRHLLGGGAALGPTPSPSRDMAREERLCRRAELAFGRALPAGLGAPVIARAEASLALDDADVAPVIDWGDAHAAQVRVDNRSGGRQT